MCQRLFYQQNALRRGAYDPCFRGGRLCWKGKEIFDNMRRNYVSQTKYNKDSIKELIQGFIEGSAQIDARLIMSYRDKEYPTAAELKEMFRGDMAILIFVVVRFRTG